MTTIEEPLIYASNKLSGNFETRWVVPAFSQSMM